MQKNISPLFKSSKFTLNWNKTAKIQRNEVKAIENIKKHGKFVIDEKIPAYNDYINKCRANKYAANNFKNSTEKAIGMYIIKAQRLGNLPVFGDTPCIIRFTWHEGKANRDVDNIQSGQKFVLDALQKYGIIGNDNQKHVKQIFHEVVRSDNGKYYVTVELTEHNHIEDIALI